MSKTKKPQHLREKEVCGRGRERERGRLLSKKSCVEREEELKRFLSQTQEELTVAKFP